MALIWGGRRPNQDIYEVLGRGGSVQRGREAIESRPRHFGRLLGLLGAIIAAWLMVGGILFTIQLIQGRVF